MHTTEQACVRSEAVQLVSMALQLKVPSAASQLQNALHVNSVMTIGDGPHVADGEAKHQRPKPPSGPVADAARLSLAIVVAAMMKLVEERMVGRGRVVLDALKDEGVRGDEKKMGQVRLKGGFSLGDFMSRWFERWDV
jgi:hypothetical protein